MDVAVTGAGIMVNREVEYEFQGNAALRCHAAGSDRAPSIIKMINNQNLRQLIARAHVILT